MEEIRIALAGNPNVGKSTIFNTLTGMKQHTGNWAGKTVSNAFGEFTFGSKRIILTDIPGTYSLYANSPDEAAAGEHICFDAPDGVIIVCDAVCLERNLSLALQISEVNPNIILCINLIDEARKNKININAKKISQMLGIPVICTCAKTKEGIKELMKAASEIKSSSFEPYRPDYPESIRSSISALAEELDKENVNYPNKEWLAVRILECDPIMLGMFENHLGLSKDTLKKYSTIFNKSDLMPQKIRSIISNVIQRKAEEIFNASVRYENKNYKSKDINADKILTGIWGIPVMLAMLVCILWITIEGANYPSAALAFIFEKAEAFLENIFIRTNSPEWLTGLLLHGVFRTLGWIISVMLPPMAIFFPLFTLLEDIGYLPRIAFSLDKCFKCCGSCGKQSLTMCMGFGCNAAGITGCRIIGSEKERLIAMLTNAFMPCNGRFPMIISIMSIFFVTGIPSPLQSLFSALFLTGVIAFAAFVTFLASFILSKTLLKGIPSTFTLELPPYRIPKFRDVIIRSFLDRTLKVLLRAVVVAIPAGAIIWILSNVFLEGSSLLRIMTDFLDYPAYFMGIDGTILTGFILGLPANETVVPVMLMSYLSADTLSFGNDALDIGQIFLSNGWTFKTALCTVIFCVFHWPCSTTIITMYKESRSLKWTLLSVFIPTFIGIVLCCMINFIFSI